MSIRKTQFGTYRVEVYLPKDVCHKLGVNNKRLKKTVKTRSEANKLENKFLNQIDQVRLTGSVDSIVDKPDITLQEFYKTKWLPLYLQGATGHAGRLPKKSTADLTQRLFRLHILPLFGAMTLNQLNNSPAFVVDKLTACAKTFANVKQLASYTGQIFSEANYRQYIAKDNISPEIHRVAPVKKLKLREKREANGGDALTASELLSWMKAVSNDYKQGKLSLQDYVLFNVTLSLADRKSESYALRWRDIDFRNGYITIKHSLDNKGKLQATKGNKKTKFQVEPSLLVLLGSWQKIQANELQDVGIQSSLDQFVFSYTNNRGEINQPLHPFYLNNRLKTIKKRHPSLVSTHPHALRHTVATMLSEAGMSIGDISKALTHSDPRTTKLYIDAPNVVKSSTYTTFDRYLKKQQNK